MKPLFIEKTKICLPNKKAYFSKYKCECGKDFLSTKSAVKNGKTRSCGCYRKNRLGNQRKLSDPKASTINSILHRYKNDAKRRGFVFELTSDIFRALVDSNCHYCGSAPANKAKVPHKLDIYLYNGIDRKDSLLGYNQNNCVPCCFVCNKLKGSIAYQDFIAHIHNISNFLRYKNLT